MVRLEGLFLDLERASIHRLGGLELALVVIEERQVIEASGDEWVVLAEGLLADSERAQIESFRLVELPLTATHDRQAVQRIGDVGMHLAVCGEPQFEGFLEARDGIVVATADAMGRAEGIEAGRQVDRAIRRPAAQTQALLEQLQGTWIVAEAFVDLAERQRDGGPQLWAVAELVVKAVGTVLKQGTGRERPRIRGRGHEESDEEVGQLPGFVPRRFGLDLRVEGLLHAVAQVEGESAAAQ